MDRLASMETFVRVVCVSAWKKGSDSFSVQLETGS